VRALADDIQGSAHRGVAWEEQVQLDESGLQQLSRYDDLVRQRVRQLRDSNPDAPAESAVRELRQAIDQREDLLVLGRRAPALDPAQLLRSSGPSSDAADLEKLSMGDAVSYEAANYVAESVASYFAEGQTWKLVHMAPSGAAAAATWLYIGPGGLDAALLDEVTSPDEGAPGMAGASLVEAGSGTAVVDITSGSGIAQGVLVNYRRYRDAQHLALVERWPDGATHAYAGRLLSHGDLQVWPAVARPSN
jgi:hypothetical protein